MRNIGNVVDRLAVLKAKIADLNIEKGHLEDELVKAGRGGHDGVLFHANVAIFDVAKIDWKAIALKCNPSRQLIVAHTAEPKEQVRITVTARISEAAKRLAA